MIDVTFTTDLPTTTGTYLWRKATYYPIAVVKVERTWRGNYHVGMQYVSDMAGQWCGPLQIQEGENTKGTS